MRTLYHMRIAALIVLALCTFGEPVGAYASKSDILRESTKFPALYFDFAIEPIDYDWIEPCPADASKRDDPLESARALRSAGEYGKAISALERLTKSQPKSWEVWSELGRTYSEYYRKGLMALLSGRSMADPQSLSRDEIERMAGKAHECLDRAVALSPNNPRAIYYRCVDLYGSQSDDFMTGLVDLEKAALKDKNPQVQIVYLSALTAWRVRLSTGEEGAALSDLFERMSAEDRAAIGRYKKSLDKAIDKAEPEIWRAYEALGLIAAVRGDKETSIRYFQAAFDLNPGASTAYGALLVHSRETGNPAEAAGIIGRRLMVHDSAEDMLRLARVQAELGRLDLAERHCVDALKADGTNADANFVMGVLLIKRFSSTEDALDHLKKALEYGVSDRGYCNFALGIGYRLLDDKENAVKALRESGVPEARPVLEEMGEHGMIEPEKSPVEPTAGGMMA